MRRYWKLLAPLACGGVTLGWLQAAGMVYSSNIWTITLSNLIEIIIQALFGLPLTDFSGGISV